MDKESKAIDQITESANHNSDLYEFGKEVSQILKDNNLIDEAVYEVLMGK